MSQTDKPTLIQRIIQQVFPRMPDFYGMVNEQCQLAVESIDTLSEFMESGDPQKALRVRELEHMGDEIKRRNLDTLASAFATPLDREDLYRAIESIDVVMNYCKTTVREMEVLGVEPDEHLREMTARLREGVDALQRGFGKMAKEPEMVQEDAILVRKSERNVEKVYRRALADLFGSTAGDIQAMEEGKSGFFPKAMVQVSEIFRRREVYRHVSNTADQLAKAGDIMRDIAVQNA